MLLIIEKTNHKLKTVETDINDNDINVVENEAQAGH